VAGKFRRPSTPAQRAKAAAARDAKLAALHQTLTEQVRALATGPAWRRWLDVGGRFHTYSFNNTLLLLAQKPDATRVAGYNLWRELGRQVTKGEQGLMILAPVTRRSADAAAAGTAAERTVEADPVVDDPAATTGARHVVGFRPAYVWDITQTTGEPLPIPPPPRLLAGQAPAGLWEALAAQCAAAGYTVTRRPIAGQDGPNGYTAYATREVVVRADVDDAQAVKTLAHELAHVVHDDPAGFPAGQTGGCRGSREVEAESVAYLVAADFGLDTSDYTFAYVTAWAAQTGDVDAALRAAGARVLATAHQILDAAHADLAPVQAGAAGQLAAEVETLAARATAGAERTAAVGAPATAAPAGSERHRLLAANAAAVDFFAGQYATSWAPAYLQRRIGTSLLGADPRHADPRHADPRHADPRHADPAAAVRVGYAPAGWTALTEHLRDRGFTADEVLAAGLGTRARTGRVLDRFRDRLVFPIRDRLDGAVGVVGFVGRRNPAADAADTKGDQRAPKYLNTGQTPLYRKGTHLFGLTEATGTLDRGGLAVLVEGPLDALAVEHATAGAMAGVAPLGTTLTTTQAGQLGAVLGAGSNRVVVALDADPAGQQAAARAYTGLTAHGLDPRAAVLPTGLDPADTAELHGPAALVDRLALAQPMGRQLVDQALAGRELRWAEDRVTAARSAAGIIIQAPTASWEREIAAVAASTGLDESLLRTAVVDALDPDTEPLGRLRARDRRDDLDRGQHLPPTAAAIAAVSASPATSVRRPQQPPADAARWPAAVARGRAHR